jgi:hypothetical protein
MKTINFGSVMHLSLVLGREHRLNLPRIDLEQRRASGNDLNRLVAKAGDKKSNSGVPPKG